ncbi:GGDEF domain-containing protein [Shewanella psychrotolerans]|uniref:GGDEF domain-containing protein n=1 Tax=Shewanella psychrotolerans TaxID=2864206 RepID=UPI001C65C63B|nr:GGDEF domain-containing protein [Shewanella psychrotolerans]QYK03008.1 GGDEF domain-containing protein [Shewanella psychrotolerans]
MSKELMRTAATNLKKAVPLMLKHQIPTTPTNYALWYAYVGEQDPALVEKMDTIVSQYNTCPPINAELLYREHISDPVEIDVLDMRQNLEAMTVELAQSLKDTNHDATQFQQRVDNNFNKLNQIEEEGVSLEKVLGLIRSLVKESEEIRSSTEYFTGRLEKAQKEIDALRAELKRSEKDVYYDALTGVLNRRAFDQELDGLLAQAPEGTCLIMADIDYFKQFNDNYGHQLGDSVLKAVAKRLGDSCRDGIKIYRYGGEEFAIIVPNSHQRKARHLAEAMRRSLEKVSLKDRRKDQLIDNISASFGVCEWQKNESASQLIERTDKFLYEAKRLGRNRVMPI